MGGFSRTLSYQHDAGGRRTRLTFPDGNYLTYDHDPAGRLTAIRENGGTAVATFSYDGAARLSGRASPGAGSSYGYDPVSRLSSLGHDLAGTSADQSLTFGYNPASQITGRTSANNAYASNTASNVSRSYAVNGLNQYTSAGPATLGYDANGNLTSDGTTTYVYDAENRLVSASGGVALAWDPLGRLFQTSGGTAGTTRFLYDGDELAAEYDGAGNLLRRYAHGAGDDDPIVWYEGAGLTQRRSLFADHQGSIVAVADAGGAATAINAYDAWGIPNAGNQGRFQYTGQAWIAELGMYHYKARIYSPTLGRFLQTDPVGYEDQINLYTYVGNDPVNGSDPTGTRCETPTGSLICRRTEQVSIGTSSDGARAYIATRYVRSGEVIRVQSLATGRANDVSWLIDAAAGVGGIVRGLLGRRGSALLGSIFGASRAVTSAELLPARNAAIQYLRQNPGAADLFRSVWSSNLAGAQAVLARSSISVPAGLTPEIAAAYRTTMQYQVARGLETGNQLMIDVARARLQILERIGF